MDFGEPGSTEAKTAAPASAEDDAAPPGVEAAGLLGSLRGLVDGVVGSAQDRLELLSLELQEEKHRVVQSALWIAVFAGSVILALFFASCAVVAACWDTAARLPVTAGFAVLYIVLAIGCGVRLRRTVTRAPRPFAATIEELSIDRSCIRPKR